MAYNLYQGNSGISRRVETAETAPPPAPPEPEEEKKPPPDGKTPGAALPSLRSGLDGVLSRLDPGRLESEDLLILAILYLMYRISGDKELLLTIAAYLFL